MSDLKERVQGWLQRHGAPLELRSARILRRSGWDVEHAHFFADPLTDKPRELDLLADRTWREKTASFTFALAIDCKQSPDKPWVVFSAAPGASVRGLPMTFAAGRLAEHLLFHTIGFDEDPPSPFNVGGRIGHGIVKAFSDAKEADPSGAFAALQSVAAAAAAVSARAERRLEIGSGSFSESTIGIAVLVVDAPLYEYYADTDGVEHLSEVTKIVVATPKPVSSGLTVNVTVVHADHLDTFAADVMHSLESFGPVALEATSEIVAEQRKRAKRGPI